MRYCRTRIIAFIAALAAAAALAACGDSDSSAKAQNINTATAAPKTTAAASAAGSPEPGTDTAGSNSDPVDENSFPPNTEPETRRPREADDNIAAPFSFTEYTITATYKDKETDKTYEGVIANQDALEQLWTLIGYAERCEPVKLASAGKYDTASITLEPEWGGEPVTVETCIGYETEGQCGGPLVIRFKGRSSKDGSDLCVPLCEIGGSGINYSERWLEDFCRKCLVEGWGERDGRLPVGMEDTDLVFICRNTNFAEGVQDNGSAVDKEGNVYRFDFTDENTGYDYECPDESQMIEVIGRLRKEGKLTASAKVDKQTLESLVDMAKDISPDAEYSDTGEVIYDGGDSSLYIVTDRIIRLSRSGMSNEFLNDPAALEIKRQFRDMMKKAE
ncbi:MAG: hypothetical protein IKO27_01545 [Ruminococcus sp.]|nr:hypothetical protein [Ruminococcus sp.]